MKKMLGASARWRMRNGVFQFPYEFKAYHRARQLLDKVWTTRLAPR